MATSLLPREHVNTKYVRLRSIPVSGEGFMFPVLQDTPEELIVDSTFEGDREMRPAIRFTYDSQPDMVRDAAGRKFEITQIFERDEDGRLIPGNR
jgi:hypothetical protein